MTIRDDIQQVQNEIRQAELAERNRIAAENAHKQVIADKQAHLLQLSIQSGLEDFHRLKAQADTIAQQTIDNATALYAAFQALDMPGAITLYKKQVELFNQLTTTNRAALNALQEASRIRWNHLVNNPSLVTEGDQFKPVDYQASAQVNAEMQHHRNAIKWGIAAIPAVLAAAARVTDPDKKLPAQGLCFGLLGQAYNTAPNYDPVKATLETMTRTR